MNLEKNDDASERPLDLIVRGWHPIETAPKDETSILIVRSMAGEEPAYRVAFWSDQSPDFPWKVEDACGAFAHYKNFPTHWMPLPEAPNAEVS